MSGVHFLGFKAVLQSIEMMFCNVAIRDDAALNWSKPLFYQPASLTNEPSSNQHFIRAIGEIDADGAFDILSGFC